MKAKVIGREVYDDGDVLLAQCANEEAAEYAAAALDLMSWARRGLKAQVTLCIRLESGMVEVGELTFTPDGFALDGRAKTIDAAVRAALGGSEADS